MQLILSGRKNYARIEEILPLPNLIQVQLDSFRWFQEEGLRELFEEISPIQSYNKVLELHFLDYEFGKPKYTVEECKLRDLTYAAPLWVKVRLVNNETGEIQEQRIFFGDFPLMTEKGTFIINGAERVVVNQLLRSPGVYFSLEEERATGRLLCYAKLIPNRGAWLEFETSKRDVISVKIERKRKLPVTVLLRALGYGTDEELLALYEGIDTMPEHSYIKATIEADPTKSTEEALVEIYRRMRPGEPANPENARNYLIALFFNPRRYDLGKMGRYKLNRRLGLDIPLDHRTLTRDDLVKVVEKMILINNGVESEDDIDHLGNRRVRTVGELVQNQMRVGLLRLERAIKERMSIKEPEEVTPLSLINIRPVVAALREFFGGSQLSQFMDQTNPLAELTHKRRVSALGPGGLKRERAGFEVRDVHNSHYGRVCPIETPEGPNIGLIGSLATYARVNDFGFLETPYRKVLNKVPNRPQDLVGHILRERIIDPTTGELIAEAGTEITPELAERISRLQYREIKIRPVVTNEIVYLSADEEDQYVIAQAGVPLDSKGRFLTDRVTVRHMQQFAIRPVDQVDYMDVSPKQIVSVSASLIPFLEHDDANRALMGSNMQRQAVPLVKPEAPLVSTGMEYYVAKDSGQVVLAEEDGEVVSVTSTQIVVKGEKGLRIYPLKRYQRSNQATCIDQRPIVSKGQKVKKGQVLADSSSTQNGELALGQNVLVAFISWEGGNYEDAVLVSEALVQEDIYTSIHIEEYETEAVDTKLGPEEITRDIPNVGEEVLRDLDENGIIRIGAQVGPGDILVGKITPKGETELSPEEKLLRAIFGERARDVRDTSLRMPHGERGVVISVAEFSRDQYRDLPAGVEKVVKVYVAQRRKLTEGDKMAGRHGNKGVISKIVPVEDMPFLPDGTPIEVILNPLGVPARMNLGQILETHLGWAAYRLGFKAITPVFDGADQDEVFAELARAWLIDKAWEEITDRAWQWLKSIEYNPQDIEDDEEARRLYLVEWIGDRYDPEKLMEDWNYARRSALKEWLRERGYDPDAILVFEDDPRPLEARREADRLARLVCLREWIGSLTGEYPPLEGVSEEKLMEKAIQVSKATGQPVPTTGKMILYDGKTGEPYDQPVTVGVMMIMKLIHLVEDKVHARSTGPYSLVTQQPLGGKAQFGGQRFGEMEVWALEAYGAAHTLQEMLTVKSDDTTGRLKTYEAIVRGERVSGPEMPESFRVLVKELQSLGLSVEVYDAKGDKYTFGKEEREEKPIPLGFGSFDLARKLLSK
ncbi:MAG: DNA-directed RNA polymerase subunit beta [Anaerolineae bacterium]|nr:DNA-directed RNA polymerase subunit beta [Anaerolineae bacterium]MDW8103112.1 DNA-directed RNA polymerase subunit beta [Anaerolineae bacterium]